MAASRKRYNISEVLDKLDLLEEEYFTDDNIDRNSDDQLEDIEPDSGGDSEATEDYMTPRIWMLMDILPPTEKKKAPTTKCVVCNKRGIRKETRYFCCICASKPALCVVPYFGEFHTQTYY